MSIIDVQRQLLQLGYDLGPAGADGVNGRRTQTAVAQFQREYAVGVKWPGTIGPRTVVALAAAVSRCDGTLAPPPPSKTPLLPWYEEAQRLKGIREIPGPKHNSTILGWAKKLGGWVAGYYDSDEIPWCGLFVAHCMGATLPSEPIPGNPLSALAWKMFGVPCLPTTGALLVFTRSGGGHVGFYAGERADAFLVLGGNQSNQVNLTWVAKSRHIATRWPSTAAAPTTGKVVVKGDGALSTNEA